MWRQRDIQQRAVYVEKESDFLGVNGIKFHELSLQGSRRAGLERTKTTAFVQDLARHREVECLLRETPKQAVGSRRRIQIL
jgi:hypothetical protein